MKVQAFDDILKADEKRAWKSVKEVIVGVLGKNRAENYEELVQKMMKYFQKVGVSMSLKIHFLHHHLPYFAQQLATESDEQGERYHQVALPFESR